MLKEPSQKYSPHIPIALPDHAPRWLSTDLRDGNQALAAVTSNHAL